MIQAFALGALAGAAINVVPKVIESITRPFKGAADTVTGFIAGFEELADAPWQEQVAGYSSAFEGIYGVSPFEILTPLSTGVVDVISGAGEWFSDLF